jgi:hypothetical protein
MEYDSAATPGYRFIWRMSRKQKDRWPLLRVNHVAAVVVGQAQLDVASISRISLHIDDERAGYREHDISTGSEIASPGTIWSMRADRVAIGRELIVQEVSLPLPRVVACDSMSMESAVLASGTVFQFVVDYDVLFIEDHEAWIRQKNRDCHDAV